jgi:hypothetical protein
MLRFCSTHLKNLSASLAGGPLAAAGPLAATGLASSRGCHRVLVKSVRHIGPTYVHNRYIDVSTLMYIKMIYIKETKN